MKKLQLFRNGSEIIASDGLLYVDGRLNLSSIKNAVRNRNANFAVNFPHKIADSFAIYKGNSIRNGYSKIISL